MKRRMRSVDSYFGFVQVNVDYLDILSFGKLFVDTNLSLCILLVLRLRAESFIYYSVFLYKHTKNRVNLFALINNLLTKIPNKVVLSVFSHFFRHYNRQVLCNRRRDIFPDGQEWFLHFLYCLLLLLLQLR